MKYQRFILFSVLTIFSFALLQCGSGNDIVTITSDNNVSTMSAVFGTYGSEAANSVVETTDGYFVIAGVKSDSTGYHIAQDSEDGYIVKINKHGQEIWTKYFGGSKDDALYSIKQTNDGGFVAAGYTYSFSNDGIHSDVYLIRLDSNGNLIWYKTYDEGDSDAANYIQITNDNGFIIAGRSYNLSSNTQNILLVRTDSYGNKLWSHMYSIGLLGDSASSVIETIDGGFIIAGEANMGVSAGQKDIALLKTDKDGNELWQKRFGGPYDDVSRSVVRTNDGGFAIAGSVQIDIYSAEGTKMILIRTNSNGDELWEQIYDVPNEAMRANSIQQTPDGGFIFVGNNPFSVGHYTVNLFKTDEYGNKLWVTKYYGNAGTQASEIKVTSDGGYVIAGINFSIDQFGFYNADALIYKTDDYGLIR